LNIEREHFQETLKSGAYTIIFDGLDEIISTHRNVLDKSLKEFVDIYNEDDEIDIYEAIGLPADDDCYELPNYIILGFKNIVWELLSNHGYVDYGTSLDYAWLEDKGMYALAALRWEALSAKYNDNTLYAFDGRIENYNKTEEE